MPIAVRGQRSPEVMMHVPHEVDKAAIRALIRECASGTLGLLDSMGRPRPPGWDEFLLKQATDKMPVLNFYAPERFSGSLATQLSIVLAMEWRRDLSTGRSVEIPERLRSSRQWIRMSANAAHIHHGEQAEMTWFLGKARCPIEILEPDFACADVDTTLYANLDVDPWERAWPLMIFGPERVKAIGRETLLDAPAWKVEELPYGGIWVQVWENPFDAPQKMVTALGKHLGIEARPK